MAKFYSPLSQTFGSRPDDFGYNAGTDFKKSHIKLNHKLTKLRQYCNVLNKNTKSFDSKKLSQFSADSYVKENKLQGALVLHLIERDLIYVENLRLNQKVGKKNQRVDTRLKKASKYASGLRKLIRLEKVWQTKLEYYVYSELANIEYFSTTSNKHSVTSKDVVLKYIKVLMGLDLLLQDRLANSTSQEIEKFQKIIETIKNKYRHVQLKDFIKNKNDVDKILNKSRSKKNKKTAQDEPCVITEILIKNKYTPNYLFLDLKSDALSNKKYIKTIEWRSFSAEIKDDDVAKYLTIALKLQKQKALFSKKSHVKKGKNTTTNTNNNTNSSKEEKVPAVKLKKVSFDEILKNFNLAEEAHFKTLDSDDNDDQVLSTFISYNKFFVLIQKESAIFHTLLKSWNNVIIFENKKSMKKTASITNIYSRLERIVKNLTSYLTQVTTLPGVYSDDELLANLHISIAYYKASLYSYCLAPLYKKDGSYVEAMALLTHSLESINNPSMEFDSNNELPGDVVNVAKLEALNDFIEKSCSNVQALALYQQKLRSKASKHEKYNNNTTVIESGFDISPSAIQLNNLFPLKPIVKPVMAKPTLYDLAYNYIDFESNRVSSSTNDSPSNTQSAISSHLDTETTEATPVEQKRGFLGFFRG